MVLAGKVQTEEIAKDGKLTIIMNRYKDMRAPGDTVSFDVC